MYTRTTSLPAVAWRALATIVFASCFATAAADDSAGVAATPAKGEITVEVGLLSLIGADLWFSYRQFDSPFQLGIRYLNIEDDFMNESAVGIPNQENDRSYTTRIGVRVDYVFQATRPHSFYVGSALYKTRLKLECESMTTPGVVETDSVSSAALYFGGGIQGRARSGLGYNVGIFMAPFFDSNLKAAGCTEENGGDMDVRATLSYTF